MRGWLTVELISPVLGDLKDEIPGVTNRQYLSWNGHDNGGGAPTRGAALPIEEDTNGRGTGTRPKAYPENLDGRRRRDRACHAGKLDHAPGEIRHRSRPRAGLSAGRANDHVRSNDDAQPNDHGPCNDHAQLTDHGPCNDTIPHLERAAPDRLPKLGVRYDR